VNGRPASASSLVKELLSEPILDLVAPVTLETLQRDVDAGEIVARNAADLLDRAGVLVVHAGDDPVNLLASLRQADANRAAVDAGAGMVEKAEFDQFLHIVGDVRSQIVAPCPQFARGQLLVADVVEQQRLDGVDVGAPAPIEFVLDDVEQSAVKPLDHGQGFQVNIRDTKFRVRAKGDILSLDCIQHSTLACSTLRGRAFVRSDYEWTVAARREDEPKIQDESMVFSVW